MENGNGPKIAAAFLLGAVVGGVTALLYTPKSGKNLRGDISDEIKNYVQKAAVFKNKIVENAKKFSNEIINQAEKVCSDVKNFEEGKYAGTAEKIEDEISRLRKAIRTGIDSYKDTKKIRKFFPNEDKYFFTDFGDYLFDEDEKEDLPKFESMKKRRS